MWMLLCLIKIGLLKYFILFEDGEFMDKDWFGKECFYFNGVWAYSEEFEPEICFCSHKDNPENVEGNCYRAICPLYTKKHKKEDMAFYKCEKS